MHTETSTNDQTHSETEVSSGFGATVDGKWCNADEVAVRFKSDDRDGPRIIGASPDFIELSVPSQSGEA